MNKLLGYLILFVSISYVGLAQPKFVIIGGDEYNWGKVKPSDSPLKADVIFKNEGTENLIIKKVNPTCGCTAAKPEKDTLVPGDTTVMKVDLRLGGSTGIFHKNITIQTNDPQRQSVNYKLVCDIVRAIIFKPNDAMSFKGEHIAVGKESAETVTIKNNSDTGIKFYDVEVVPNIVKLTIPKDFTLKPGEEIEVTGRHTPTKAGHFNAKINMKTNHPDFPTITIGIYGDAKQNPLLNEIEPDKKINK